ncbi:potassium voltage-gated channel protein Shaw-like [Mercenaria mercenaria]|uniref:potassium voltage-gated channel protein Shaw-like n=1 Tax=Mercenaria mercenaria TaxID=6596 RepID=UPI001E1E0EB1|nr:potassium voltage-gated channel protein Shaw-like [Mercenaria mercenaria]
MLEHDGANKPVYLATQEADSLSDDLPGEETPVISPADTLPAKNDSQYSEDEDRIVLNVGGVRHETHLTTLRKIEHTRLSRLAEQHEFSDSQKEVYFFDRHPAVFNSIIDFYRSGELHVPLEVCGAVVKRELDYWQITENHIKSCCWRNYRSYIENKRILDSFNRSILKQQMCIDTDGLKGWEKYRTKMWLILEYPRTSRAAMTFGVVSLMFVVLSILGFCLETLPDLRPTNVSLDANSTKLCDGKNVSASFMLQPNAGLNILDIICTAFFTAELIIRFIFSPNKLRFVRSAMNIIDLLALVPLYMQLILNSDAFKFCYVNERLIFEIMFILRIIRMFRIFHLVKHYQALQILIYALKASIQELLMLLIFLLIGMLVFATMIYYAEREDAVNPGSQFPTIPVGFWWAIITMTTVGYGDVTPTKPVGYVVGTCCAVSGVLMVALTIPVISNNFTLFYTHVRSRGGSNSSTEDLHDINSEILLHSEDGAKIYENARRTSNGSIIMNEKSFTLARKGSDISALTADPYTNGKCGHNGDVRYGRMLGDAVPRHTTSTSMSDVGLKHEEADYYITHAGAVKAHSDDGVMYSDTQC